MQKNITKKQSLGVAVSSAVVALCVFAVTVVVAASLSVEDNAQFLLFWSTAFMVLVSMLGIQQETTRAIGVATSLNSENPVPRGAHPIAVAAFLGALVALLLLLSSALWGRSVLGESYLTAVAVIAGCTFVYACHVAFVGISAGAGQWTIFALLGGVEGGLRLVLTALVAFIGGSLWGFQWAAVIPVVVWVIFIAVSRPSRQLLSHRTTLSFSGLARTMSWSILSSTAYALMITGFPVLLQLSEPDSPTAAQTYLLAATILGVNITRAPIMIPLQTFQGVAISEFLRRKDEPIKALLKPCGALLALGAVGAVAAYLIGPFLFDLLYSKYAGSLSGIVLGLLTFASAFMALVVLSGTASLALGMHRLYLGGWIVTVAVSLALLFLLPLPVDVRAIVALFAGPAAGFVTHLLGLKLKVSAS